MSLEGKAVVVTGGGRGLGRALSRAFAAEGAYLCVADIDLESARETVRDLDGQRSPALACRLDVSNPASWDELRDLLIASHGRCDVLCNNAGIMRIAPFGDADLADWEAQANVNIMGPMLGCRAMLPLMLEQGGGVILNTASLAGLHPWPHGALYTASKYATVGFSETLREELAGTGVHVAILCPGGIDTPMNDGIETSGERLESPERVARLVLDGIRERRDWIFTHEEYLPMLDERHRAIVSDHEPLCRTVPEDSL